MILRLLVTTLVLTSVVRANREERAFHARCAALLKAKEAGAGGTNERQLRDENYYLPKCRGGTDDSWYNFDAEIKNFSPNCDEQDRFIMGALVSELVREVECSIPEYEDEIFTGQMCEMPVIVPDRRILANTTTTTKKRRYAYRGGGRCRRCRRRQERRELRDLQELTEEAVCSLAANARLGVRIAENEVLDAYDTYAEVMDLAETFYDLKKGEKLVKDAEKKVSEAEEHEAEARKEAQKTEEWCKQGIRDASYDNLKKALHEAEKSERKAMDETVKTADSSRKVKEVKANLIEAEIKYETDDKKDKMKKLVEKMKEDVDERIEKLDEEIAKRKEQKGKEKEKGNKDKVEELDVKINSMENEKKKLSAESKEAAKFLEQGVEMDEKIALLRTRLSVADDENQWLKTFSGLLEQEIPKKLLYYYNVTSGGCLEETVYPDASVKCWAVDKREETKPLEECELDFIYVE